MANIDNLFRVGQANAFTSFSSHSNMGGSGGEGVKRTSTSTKFINGKKMTTMK
jgi:hypothetical protein